MNPKCKLVLAVIAGAGLGAAAIQSLHAQAKPPAYVVTEVEIRDEAAFKEFSPMVGKTVEASGRKYLTRGGRIVALEGQPPEALYLKHIPERGGGTVLAQFGRLEGAHTTPREGGEDPRVHC